MSDKQYFQWGIRERVYPIHLGYHHLFVRWVRWNRSARSGDIIVWFVPSAEVNRLARTKK